MLFRSEEACRLALDPDDDNDYSDAEICDGSDGETVIGSIECDGEDVEVPDAYYYSDEQKQAAAMRDALQKIAHKARTGEGDFNVAELAELAESVLKEFCDE